MGVTVKILYPHMKAMTNDRDQVEVQGGTIGQCLLNLIGQFPGLRPMVFDGSGGLLPFVVIYHNGKGTYTEPDPLVRAVTKGDELTITLLLAGG